MDGVFHVVHPKQEAVMKETYRVPTKMASGIFSMASGGAAAALIPGQIDISGQTGGITSRTTPYILAGSIFLLGCWLLFSSVVLKKEDYREISVSDEISRMGFILSLALYVFVMDIIGFLVSSLLMGGFTLWYMKDRKFGHYAVVFVCVTAIYLIFRYLLGVNFSSVWGV